MKIKKINGIPRIVVSGTVINNGAKIHSEFIFPSRPINFLSDLTLFHRSKLNHHNVNVNFEAGVYLSHLRVTKPEDRILAVGLGRGSTLIPMVKFMDPSGGGFYRCIEASSSQIEIAKKNIELNDIDHSRFEILNGFAGSEVYAAYGEKSNNGIDINSYNFDVLEMDCEGSELSILLSLTKRPRNIIVELHPDYFDEKYKDFDTFLILMENKGYKYQFAFGHNGDYLDFQNARKYYNSTNNRTTLKNYRIDDKENFFFLVYPIVITFIFNQYIGKSN